jgi:hypothetical protein
VDVTPKLSVFGTAYRAYAVIFKNSGFLFRSGWLPVVFALFLLVAADWFFFWLGWYNLDRIFSWQSLVMGITYSLITASCISVLAVQWHQRILQAPAASTAKLFYTYGLTALLLEASVNTFAHLTAFVNEYSANSATRAAAAITMLGVIYLWCRLELILPAIAVGGDSSLAASWSATRSNGLRIAASSILCIFCLVAIYATPITIYYLMYGVAGPQPLGEAVKRATWEAVPSIGSNLWALASVIVYISFLSLCYRELVLQPRAPDAS